MSTFLLICEKACTDKDTTSQEVRVKVLFYGESPIIETGLAQVAKRHIETFLELGWDVEVVAMNHSMKHYDRSKYPFLIHECPENDSYNLQNMHNAIIRGDYDIIFFSTDIQFVKAHDDTILEMRGQKQFRSIVYSPIDCDIMNKEALSGIVLSDIAVTATFHAKSVFNRIIPGKDVRVIYHGCEPDIFYPLDIKERSELRKQIFNIDDNTFVVLFVGRNQQRKDFARGMYAFHIFHKLYPDSLLYMHSKQNDIGGSLPFYAKVLGMKFGTNKRDEIYFTPQDFSEAIGIPRKEMNKVYNIADVYASSSTGEGWGLCTTEAMSAGTSVLVPRNTSHIEIIGENEDRGYFIDCGGENLWIMPYGFTSNPRDIISVRSMVDGMETIYHNRAEANTKAVSAREWTKDHTWERFKKEWKKILIHLESSMKKEI